MANMRVYELANSLGLDVEKAIELLREVGAPPRNHLSVVERVPARRVRQLLKQNTKAALPPTQIPSSPPPPVQPPGVKREPAAIAPDTAGDSAAKDAPTPVSAPSVADGKADKSSPSPAQPAASREQPETAASPPTASPPAAERPATEAPPRVKPRDPAAAKVKPADSPAEKAVAKATEPERPEDVAVKQAVRAERAAQSAAAQRPRPAAQPKQPAAKAPAPDRAKRESAPRPAAAPRNAAPAETRPSRPQRDGQQRDSQQRRPRPAASGAQRGPTGPGGRPGGTATGTARRTRKRATAKAAATARDAAAAARPVGPVVIPDSLTVQELAELLNVNPTTIILKLMEAGVMAAINQRIEYEVAAEVAEVLEFEVTRPEKEERAHHDLQESEEDLTARPPVVTIMGHVDHGKTTLLDVIRRAKVAAGEAGGITQHIGAYQIEVSGEPITFLDTPGHEAFTSMRSRGAQVTDVAVLVVAADDGIMPQTVEAISHARAAEVPIIVAINKMDRPGANPDRIKQQLADNGLIPEDWGGETICVEVSALQEEGIDDLLEMILLVAEMRELKANPDRLALGVVIDAELDKSRGPVATVLVQAGTLHVGDPLVAGTIHGRVRAMYDETGNAITEALPSRPVAILGLADVPRAGDLMEAVADDRTARHIASERAGQAQETESQRGAGRIRLSEIHSQAQAGAVKDLNLLIKGDVQGSVEALRQSIEKITSEEVRINVIHAAVGGINESDVALAAASDAIIIGFNVRPEATARRAADREDVEIRLYRVIYEAIEEIEAAMVGLFDPTYEEVVLGRAEVRELFRVPNIGTVAGCYVVDGKILRQAEARLIRDHVVIHEGPLGSLKRFKDDVREVNEGYECGIGFRQYSDIKVGDIIEAFRMDEVKRGL